MSIEHGLKWGIGTRGGWLWPAVVACLSYGAAAPANDLAEAIAAGSTGLDLRYRIEHVDQDGFDKPANASTLRMRLNYSTQPYRDVSAFVEFDYVAELLADNFNSGGGTSPDRVRYPVVADPHGSDLNQFFLDWRASDTVLLRAGRQRILLDNQRFVGGVGWRQNEQTYDGMTVHYTGMSNLEMRYSWVGRVNRIFGDRSSTGGRHDGSMHLANAALSLAKNWKLTPYAYLIDNDDSADLSTATVGARLTGSFKLGGRPLSFTAEAATQSDAHDAPVDYTAAYWRIDGSLALSENLRVVAGYEVLGGDADEAGKAFRTPLATLHAFNGWADQFLATPDAGLADLFAGVGWSWNGWLFDAIYHDFEAQAGEASLGRELDFSIARPLGERYWLLLKGALFESNGLAYGDTSTVWLVLSASY